VSIVTVAVALQNASIVKSRYRELFARLRLETYAAAPVPDALVKMTGVLSRNPPPPFVTAIPAMEPDVVADTCAAAP
jgi:hypothetical protein